MPTIEAFQQWLKTDGNVSSVKHYTAGLVNINEILQLPGYGVFDDAIDLEYVKNLDINTSSISKSHLTHLNKMIEFRNRNSITYNTPHI